MYFGDNRRNWVAPYAGPVMVACDCTYSEAVDRLVAVCEDYGFVEGTLVEATDVDGAIQAAIDLDR